jgi:hypothetical protein
MNPHRFSSPTIAPVPNEAPVALQSFVVVPACLLPVAPGSYQSQLYAWAYAQAEAAQQRMTRTPDLFAIFN